MFINNQFRCHCEENFSSMKQSSTLVLNQCFNNVCTIGRKVEDCRVGVSHLLAMTISTLTLAAFLSTSITSESWAELISCINGVREDGITACAKCGTNCNWEIEDGTLKISGSGEMYDYKETPSAYINHPWNDYQSQITVVKVEGVNKIGRGALADLTNATSIDIGNSVTTIGQDGLYRMGLTSLTVPDSVTSIGPSAFALMQSLTQIIIPDSVTISSMGMGGIIVLNDVDIICKGDIQKCQNLVKSYGYWDENGVFRRIDLSGKVQPASEKQCNSVNYYWSGESCNDKRNGIKCAANWRQIEDFCNRIQYTPAEAAAILNDNDNTITITFKK